MKLTTLLETLKSLETRERNVIAGDVTTARNNADALQLARQIIDESATTEMLLPEVQVQYHVVRVGFEFCTRKHNCQSSAEPCNGAARPTISRVDATSISSIQTCKCPDGGNPWHGTIKSNRCSVCGLIIEAGIRL